VVDRALAIVSPSDRITFPYSLDPAPAGLSPVLSTSGSCRTASGCTCGVRASQFADGTQFLFPAPDTLTRDQALQVASKTTYTP
jgi:hypothetical protein